jgi:hypothetical protein
MMGSFYGTWAWNWPGLMTWITPPHIHINFELLLSAGLLPIRTVGEPGVHGAVVAGTQAAGVKTPNFAAVAAATAGLVMVLHIPKGGIFTMGLLSMMVAMGRLDTMVRFSGSTINVPGATPKLHCIMAPLHTAKAI